MSAPKHEPGAAPAEDPKGTAADAAGGASHPPGGSPSLRGEDPFRATFEQAPVGLAHVAPDGTLIRANARLAEMLGYAPDELTGLSVRDVTYPDDFDADLEGARRLLAGQVPRHRLEKRYVRKDGSAFWTELTVSLLRDAAGRPLHLLATIEDIDARRRAEAGRRAAEARLARKAALIDLSRDAVLVHDPATGRLTFWSRGAEALYGYTREEALGRAAADLLRTEFTVGREQILGELAATGQWEGDLVHTCKDGTRITVASRWAWGDDVGEGAEVLEVNRDVTEQRRLEAAREAYTATQERIAETLQRSLLLAPPPDLFPGLTVKPFYSGAEEDVLVGGDFFDVFAADTNKVALVVGDATGKGLEAAAYTAEVKYALRAFLREFPDPAAALTRLNGFVSDRERLDQAGLGASYVAAALAVVDTLTGDVAAALAGMEMPFLLRAGTGEVVSFRAGGPLLGAIEGWDYESQRDALGEGDVIAMTTDGLTEARHPARRLDFFGFGRLAAALREETGRTASLSEAGQAVVARARAFAGGVIHDDVCLLLARRRARE